MIQEAARMQTVSERLSMAKAAAEAADTAKGEAIVQSRTSLVRFIFLRSLSETPASFHPHLQPIDITGGMHSDGGLDLPKDPDRALHGSSFVISVQGGFCSRPSFDTRNKIDIDLLPARVRQKVRKHAKD
jgi:hypothetical protein